jgi:hypothetical protein
LQAIHLLLTPIEGEGVALVETLHKYLSLSAGGEINLREARLNGYVDSVLRLGV